MTPRTVTISLPPALGREVDRIARVERRSRSELFREAFRQYAARLERLERIFAYGKQVGKQLGITEDDVARLVKEYRREKRTR